MAISGSMWCKRDSASHRRRGRVFETITPEAMKNATDISETNPTWKWMDQDPRATR
jgi:hypothetical protein